MSAPTDLQLISFEALGTIWHIELEPVEESERLQQAVIDYVRMFEGAYSRFDTSSMLSQLNATRRLANPPQQLLDMLAHAHEMYEKSEGVFNISVGGTLQSLGYGQAGKGEGTAANVWDVLKYSAKEITMPEGVVLDFGGFGKGWLIDDIAHMLLDKGVAKFIVNGGGDMYIHMPEPIEIALEHPLDISKQIGSTRISHGALAVSSNMKRRWKRGDDEHHHIIDPHKNTSTDNDVVSTYVQAPSALIADTCATVLLIKPDLKDTLTEHFGLKTIILRKNQLI